MSNAQLIMSAATSIGNLPVTYIPKKVREIYELMVDLQQDDTEQYSSNGFYLDLVKLLQSKNPSRAIDILQKSGYLKLFLPELDALFGVPQPIEHHPEVDSGIHSLMSLTAAKKTTNNHFVLMATLFHDLGKGLTPKENLPHHYGHEDLGEPIVKKIFARWRGRNNEEVIFAEKWVSIICFYHTHCHMIEKLQPKKVVELLTAIHAFEYPDFLEWYIITCESDQRGRLGRENVQYPQKDILRTLFNEIIKKESALKNNGNLYLLTDEEKRIRRINWLHEYNKAKKYG